MSIINIYKDSYSRGAQIAEKVAGELNYECVGDEVIAEAASEFDVAEDKLRLALTHAPSLFGMSSDLRHKYITYIQTKVIEHLLKDNIVYHGPAGHVLVQGVSHVLKSRVIANLEDRIKLKQERENISVREARKSILKMDKELREVSHSIFGVDDKDANLFDLVINVGTIEVDDAVGILVNTVKNKRFHPMTYSEHCMQNIHLACKVKAAIVDIDPTAHVRADGGTVFIRAKASDKDKEKRSEEINESASKVDGIQKIEIQVTEDTIKQISETFR